jgi:hypothetical protein
MSCRKVSRELLERFRFGEEIDARSAPHLEHLQTCVACREQVGLDRALVTQLRRALQARVEGYEPSPSSWQLVRERALAESSRPAWTGWFRRLTAGIRAAGAVAAVALVLMVGTSGLGLPDTAPDFQLSVIGRGEMARADRLPRDPPPYRDPRSWARTPLPRPAAGRFSVIMTYGKTGEAVATTRPVPRLVSGLLR